MLLVVSAASKVSVQRPSPLKADGRTDGRSHAEASGAPQLRSSELRAPLLCTAGSPHFSPAAPRRPVIFSNMQRSAAGLLRKRIQDTRRQEKNITEGVFI